MLKKTEKVTTMNSSSSMWDVYLGVHVAEHALSKVFKNVKRMPTNNPGFDFICSNDYKVDVKSSCLSSHHPPKWAFSIRYNTTADYFLWIAFNDDHEHLTPLHIWLVPGHIVNHTSLISITENSLDKWAAYEIKGKLNDVKKCCDIIKIVDERSGHIPKHLPKNTILSEQINVLLTKDVHNELVIESKKRDMKLSTMMRQFIEERLEQIERKNIMMMEFTDINIDTIEGVLLCRAIGSLMSCPDHSTKTPDEMVKFLEDMSSVN